MSDPSGGAAAAAHEAHKQDPKCQAWAKSHDPHWGLGDACPHCGVFVNSADGYIVPLPTKIHLWVVTHFGQSGPGVEEAPHPFVDRSVMCRAMRRYYEDSTAPEYDYVDPSTIESDDELIEYVRNKTDDLVYELNLIGPNLTTKTQTHELDEGPITGTYATPYQTIVLLDRNHFGQDDPKSPEVWSAHTDPSCLTLLRRTDRLYQVQVT